MTTELAMRRDGNKLVPSNQMSDEDMSRLPLGKELLVTVNVPRNLKQLKFVWALASKIADARDDILDKEVAMDVLCEMVRHVKIVVNPISGSAMMTRKSLRIGQDEMSRLIDRMVFVTCSEIIPGLEEGKLRQEIAAMVGA